MDFDASLLVIMVAFWVAYGILSRFFFGPMLALIEGRRQEVESAQAVYDEAFTETEATLEEQREALHDARLQARSVREELRRQAQEKRAEILAEAKSESDAQSEKARVELEDQVARERGSLEEKALALAEEMSARLLRRAS